MISSTNGIVPKVAPESITIGVACEEVAKAQDFEGSDEGTFERNSEIYDLGLNDGNLLGAVDRNWEYS